VLVGSIGQTAILSFVPSCTVVHFDVSFEIGGARGEQSNPLAIAAVNMGCQVSIGIIGEEIDVVATGSFCYIKP